MDSTTFVDKVKEYQHHSEQAQKRKGEKPTNKSSRAELEDFFSNTTIILARPETGIQVRTNIITSTYPPSTTPLASLKPLKLSDLWLETRHTGTALLVKSFGNAKQIDGDAAVCNAVEDEDGDVLRICIYNSDPGLTPEQVLPKGAVVALKEPFCTFTVDGGSVIRIDHSSDLVLLDPGSERIPAGLAPPCDEKLEKTAAQLKADGNAAYASRDFIAAVARYTDALGACTEADGSLKYDLYRNRANANLLLGRYESAASDAKAAVIPTITAEDLDGARLNAKAWYRAGRASYLLGEYKKAEISYKIAVSLTPDDPEIQVELKRVEERLEEQKEGAYDFEKMAEEVLLKSGRRLDHAGFVSNTVVKDAGKHGRGLYATKDLKAGDLVLVEKAFAYEEDRSGEDIFTILNLNNKRSSHGPHAALLLDVVRRLRYNLQQAKHFFNLYDGDYDPKPQPEVTDGTVVVDTLRASAILELNRFDIPAAEPSATEETGFSSVGVWLYASHMNHACNGNAVRAFIGDVMIIRATRDIGEGEEIMMRYCDPMAHNERTQEHLDESWGFKCDCRICEAEAKIADALKLTRKELVSSVESFLSGNLITAENVPDEDAVANALSLHAEIETTYDPALFDKLPRLCLPDLDIWLCQAHFSHSSHGKVLEWSVQALRDLGYHVNVESKSVQIDRTTCFISINAVDAAMYAAHAYYADRKDEIGMRFEDFARMTWVSLYAEEKGFEKRYGGS